LEPVFEAEYRRYLQNVEQGHPDFRSEYGMRSGARVQEWPVKGGIYISFILASDLNSISWDWIDSIISLG
jgi:hypothetical protein